MSKKKIYTILLSGIIGVFFLVIVSISIYQNRIKKELTEKLQIWLQKPEGTFVIEQEVLSNTFSGKDIYKIQYGNEKKEYECSIYEEKSKEWIKKEEEAEFYEKAFIEILQACMPNGYIIKKGNQYKYKKGETWEFNYDVIPKETGVVLEKIIIYGTEELKGEIVHSKTTIWCEK
jgi:hypothetical protein